MMPPAIKAAIPVVSFILGSVLLALGQPLGLAPLILGMCALALEGHYARVTREHVTDLKLLETKVSGLVGEMRLAAEAQAKDHQELISIRNHTRPVGGWVK